MRNILILFFFIVSFRLLAVCTPTTRTDVGAGSVLTSSKYNTDLNNIYAAVNSYNLACAQSNTLGVDSLNASEFEAILKGVQRGCGVSYVDSDNVQIEACIATVNGELIKKDTATNVTWANLDTGSQATGTSYWVYIDESSSGATITPKLSTSAPEQNGYNAGGDLALAKIRNNAMGDISTGTIEHFVSGSRQKTFSASINYWGISVSGVVYSSWGSWNYSGVHALDFLSCTQDASSLKCDWVDGAWEKIPTCQISPIVNEFDLNQNSLMVYLPYSYFGEPAKQDGEYNDFQIKRYVVEYDSGNIIADPTTLNIGINIICHGY